MNTPSKRKVAAPGAVLLPYQKKWANDDARWKFGLMARQVGKDFASGFEGIRDCVRADLAGKRVTWLIAAPSERQSLESFQKWKNWAEAFRLAFEDEKVTREAGPESLLQSATITFPHGSRVIAVPGKPDTVRGFSANVLLTEFAFFEQPDATWRAILPSITNAKSGGVKKVRLITTPSGIGNKAHDLWVKNFHAEANEGNEEEKNPSLSSLPSVRSSGPGWSCHFVDIYTAQQQGLPVNIEELKAALDDPDGWAQEFECQFLDVQSTLLPYELIGACESADATVYVPSEFWQSTTPFPLVMGIDFGRRHDLTVAWTLGQLGDVHQTVEVLEMDKTATPEQVERLRPRLQKARRVCLDYTGPGIGLGDYLAKEFGEWNPAQHKLGKIELCTFSNTLKLEIFSKLRMIFEKRGVRVPISRLVREDLHSLNRVSSPTGQITYRAPHSADGHADRCTALALALRAAGEGAVRVSSESIPRRPEVGEMGLGKFRTDRWTM
ncbi:MAG TPA: terminase family protein [Verrucomicrobiae bacterium]|jgi:phage FluMu gp28-like protein|nr:terminase family protein [Verrucomicrobiae bacterium]